MTLLGLSILIASVSFLCYRHPPTTWSFLQWLRRPSIQNVDAPASIQKSPPTITTSDDTSHDAEKEIPTFSKEEPPISPPKKEEADRAAMPPPPPPAFKKPSSPTTPRALPSSAKTAIPSFTLTDGTDNMPPPSFPALNSAQRASGGTSFPAANSAQRASNSMPSPSFPAANSAQRASNSMPPPSFPAANSAQRARGPPRLNPTPTPGLMAPPSRPSPLPNRSPPTTSGLAPPPTHSSIPTKPRRKVLLTPNHSPLDWARHSSTLPSAPLIPVPPSLLSQKSGRKGKEAWTVLGGKVYNITPYLPYHPGGEPELLRCAGRDGSRLFAEVHPWVNWEGMLGGCLVGVPVDEEVLGGDKGGGGGMEDMD